MRPYGHEYAVVRGHSAGNAWLDATPDSLPSKQLLT